MDDKVALLVAQGIDACGGQPLGQADALRLVWHEDENGSLRDLHRRAHCLGNECGLRSARKAVNGDGQSLLGRKSRPKTVKKCEKFLVRSD